MDINEVNRLNKEFEQFHKTLQKIVLPPKELAAINEKVKSLVGMCKYCEKEKRIEENEKDNIYFQIYGKHLRVIGNLFNFNFGRDILINYCPMCGRKLGDKNE